MVYRNRTERLDELFLEWRESYPASVRSGFHADGIIEEDQYDREEHRILFVLLEPNSRKGRYNKYFGADLRKVFGETGLGKSIDKNLARWTQLILEGNCSNYEPTKHEALAHIRRVAVMNLKKLSGTGQADYCAVGIHAWNDRTWIRREIEIIAPEVIVACGDNTNRVLQWILNNDMYIEPTDEVAWKIGSIVVLPANHASVRPNNAKAALGRLTVRATMAKIGAFVSSDPS